MLCMFKTNKGNYFERNFLIHKSNYEEYSKKEAASLDEQLQKRLIE